MMKIPFLELFSGNGADPRRERNDLLKVGEEDPIFLEQFKALRSKLEYKLDMLGWKVIGVTSSIAGEGKTLTCAKLGASLAMTKRKEVLLVDADTRKADLSKGLGNPIRPGLTEYLLGHAAFRDIHPGLTEYLLGRGAFNDVVRITATPGLKTVSAGTSVSAPGDLLGREAFRTFLEEARKAFDIVLLDTPPILPVADTMSMRDRLDGLIFVYRAGYTPLAMFKQATEEIGEKKILGVVLNGVERKSERYYGKYYANYETSPKTKEAGE